MTRIMRTRRSGTANTARSSNRRSRSKKPMTSQKRNALRERINKPGVRARLQQKVQNRNTKPNTQAQGTRAGNDLGIFGRHRQEGARGRFLRRFLGIRNSPNPRPNNNHQPAPKPVNTQPTPKPVNNQPAPKPVNTQPAPKPVNNQPAPKPVNNESTRLSPQEILTGWKQGSQQNCVTTAGIKAAQAMYGAELANQTDPSRGIFKTAERTDSGGLKIEMRDGFKINLSKKELETATKYSGFRLNKSKDQALLRNANEVFAAAGKRAQIEGNDGRKPNSMTYTQALRTLNNGEDTYRTSEHLGRLGLSEYTKKVTRNDLKNYPAWVSRTPGHAYMGTGSERDYYGRSGGVGRGSNFGYVLQPIKP